MSKLTLLFNPCFIMIDSPNCSPCHTILPSQGTESVFSVARNSNAANFPNNIPIQFGIALLAHMRQRHLFLYLWPIQCSLNFAAFLRATWSFKDESFFLNRIFQVIGLCSRKKMIWAHARAVVAFVQNLWPVIGNWAKVQGEGISMGRHKLIAPERKRTIAATGLGSSPDPAAPQPWYMFWYWAILVYTFPKALLINVHRVLLECRTPPTIVRLLLHSDMPAAFAI